MNFRTETRNGLPVMVFDPPKDRKPVDPASVTITHEPITHEPMTEEERAEWDAVEGFRRKFFPTPDEAERDNWGIKLN